VRATPRPPDGDRTVRGFLARVGLSRCLEPLMDNGFEDMETLLEVHAFSAGELGLTGSDFEMLVAELRKISPEDSGAEVRPPTTSPAKARSAGKAKEKEAAAKRAAMEAAVEEKAPVEAAAAPEAGAVTEEIKEAVRQSWVMVQNIGMETLERTLYQHTFDLFPPDAPILGKRFGRVVFVLGESVSGGRDISKFVGRLKTMGARHINYHSDPELWPLLGHALHLTLAELLGDAYTEEVRDAWAAMYSYVSEVMMEGLREAQEMVATPSGLAPPRQPPPVSETQAVQRYPHILQGLIDGIEGQKAKRTPERAAFAGA